jgi:hypothetical protein
MDEESRRVDAALGAATARHMSDTKWRKVFAALRGARVRKLRWKLVRDDRFFETPVPSENELLEDRLGDILPDPYAAYREIVRQLGEFPIESSPAGIRVVGYSW